MARRFLKEDEQATTAPVLSAETVHTNADLDMQIASIQQDIAGKQADINTMNTKIAELQKQKSLNAATDSAKNVSNKQNVPVDYQQAAGTENGNKPAAGAAAPTKESFIGIQDLEDLEDFEPEEDDNSSFEFEKESDERPIVSIDEISDSILDDVEDEDEEEDETLSDEDADPSVFYIFVDDEESNEKFIGKIYKKFNDSKWREKIIEGESSIFGERAYMSYLSEEDVLEWLKSDFFDNVELIEEDDIDAFTEDNFSEETEE